MPLRCWLIILGASLAVFACTPPDPPRNTGVSVMPRAIEHPVGADPFTVTWRIVSPEGLELGAEAASLRWDISMTDPSVVTSTDPQFMESGWVRPRGNVGIVEDSYTFDFVCAGVGTTTIVFDAVLPYGEGGASRLTFEREASVRCTSLGDSGGPDAGPADAMPIDASTGIDGGPPVDGGADAGAAPRLVKPVGLFGVPDEPLRIVDERSFALFSVLFPTAAEPLSTPIVISGSHGPVWGGGPITGPGPELVEPADGDRIDRDRSLMLDSGTNSLLEIVHGGGARTVISGGAVGTGPAFDQPHSVVYDARSALAYVANSPFGGACFILCVDLSTGDRVEIWRAAGGASCSGLTLDAAGDRLVTFLNNDPTAIDLATNAETALADLPFGPDSPTYSGLQVDAASNRLAMISNRPAAFSFLDLATGEIFVVSSADRGAGPAFVRLSDLLYFATENAAYVTDSSQANVMRLNTLSGDRANVTAPD
ncbi:MAG: hypothetical protein AB8I08_02800 [Sandaracinaceae bacterium]